LQERRSYEDRTEMLRLIVDLVEASIWLKGFCLKQKMLGCLQLQIPFSYQNLQAICLFDFCSSDEQVAKVIQLIDSIAEKQAQIFSEE
jgi:hypothetical protein